MTVASIRRTITRCAVGAGLTLLLAGCGLLGDSASSNLVSPGKYDYYDCDQLFETGSKLRSREQELTELTVRASDSPAGEFVGAVAYRTELMQARGQLKQISQVAERKNCTSQSKWKSDRALW